MKKLLMSIISLGIVSILLIVILASCSKKEETTLVIATYGGAWEESLRKAIFKPFEDSTGIKINTSVHTSDFAKLKAMVESKDVIWDVVDVEGDVHARAVKAGLVEPINYNIVDSKPLLPEAIDSNGVGIVIWSTAIAYSEKAFPNGKAHPTNWAEFWDINKFPGKRGLRKDPYGTLEFSLLADGVNKDSLYPLDVDRALRKLDKIKKQIIWWETGDQQPQWLASGEVTVSSAYNGRIWAARAYDNQPLAIELGQGMMDIEWWIVPKGSKKRDVAMQFIAFASRSLYQQNIPKYISYGPVNKDAIEKIDIKLLSELPSAPRNFNKQFLANVEWWANNKDRVLEKWNKWLLE